MALWIKIVVLLAVELSGAWTEECTDPCFCPTDEEAHCVNRGLTQPPSGYWPDITTLFLSANQISVLHKRSLTGFPNVVSLHLGSNLLTELDMETFSVLPFLLYLNLGRNSITTVAEAPPGVTLGKLSSLSLFTNSISSLDPNVFSSAPALSILNLDENPLTAKEGTPFLKHPTIDVLEMADSLLTFQYLGPEVFKDLPKLGNIGLYKAKISNISGAFVYNQELHTVVLRHTLVSEVTAGTFAPTKSLKYLYLENSPLQRLDVSAVADAVPSGGRINIPNTPLACSCGYEGLYWWANGRGVRLDAACTGKEPCSFTRKTNVTLIQENEDSQT